MDDPFQDLEELAAAWVDDYEVPVVAIRGRVRRRRGVRLAAAGGGTCLVVAGLVGGLVVGAPLLGDQGTSGAMSGSASGPAPAPGALGAAPGSAGAVSGSDWPAQFERCGHPLDEPPGATALWDDRTLGADGVWHWYDRPARHLDGVWHATTVAPLPAGTTAAVLGTDVSLLQDGVVTAVQEGLGVPAVEGPSAPPTSATIDVLPATAQTTRLDVPLVSCGQYSDGHGPVKVAAGGYELVAVQELRVTGPQGSWLQLAVLRTSVTVP